MAQETFLLILESKQEHICELFDRVRAELHKAAKNKTISTYEYDEMRHKNQGYLLITLETSGNCEEVLENILKHVNDIGHYKKHVFDALMLAE